MASTDHNSGNMDSNNIIFVKQELSKYSEKLEEAKIESQKLKQEQFCLVKKECEFNSALDKTKKELFDIQSSDCPLQDKVSDLENQAFLNHEKLCKTLQLLKKKSEESVKIMLEN